MTSPQASGNSSRGLKPLIYAVDDEAMIVTLIEAILKNQGYEIKFFRDPELMIKTFLEAHPKPQLVITDFAMGAINGLELIARCKKAHPTLKTLLVSGSVDENFARLNIAKPDKFIAKPFQSKTLIDAVRSLVS